MCTWARIGLLHCENVRISSANGLRAPGELNNNVVIRDK